MDDLGDPDSNIIEALLTGDAYEVFAQSLFPFSKEAHPEASNKLTINIDGSDAIVITCEAVEVSPENVWQDEENRNNQMEIDHNEELEYLNLYKVMKFAVITYDLTIDKSIDTALRIALKLKRVICPGCVMLVGIKSNPNLPRKVSNDYVSTSCKASSIKFIEFDTLDTTVVKEFIRESFELERHMNIVKWFSTAGKLPSYEDFMEFGRFKIYELFIDAKDWDILVQQMVNDLKKLIKYHYIRLSNEPVIDLIHLLLRRRHEPPTGKTFIAVNDREVTREEYKSKDYFPRVPEYIVNYVPASNCNFQPIIFNTETNYDTQAVMKLGFKHPDEGEADDVDVKSSDSDKSLPYYHEREARYKILRCGGPWRKWANREKNADDSRQDAAASTVSPSPHQTGESGTPTGVVSTVPSPHQAGEAGTPTGVVSTVPSPHQAGEAGTPTGVLPTVPPSPHQAGGAGTTTSGSFRKPLRQRRPKKRKASEMMGVCSQCECSRCINHCLSLNDSSSDSLSSNDSAPNPGHEKKKVDDMACQLAKITTISSNVKKTVTQKGDRLKVDMIILCPNLETCRYLSATFGLVFVDEILLHLYNYVGAKETPQRFIHFQDSRINGIIKNEWDSKLKPMANHKKSFRFIQTRYGEYLNDGFHNIAVTTYEGLIKTVTANTYAAIVEQNERIEHLENFSCVMSLPSIPKVPLPSRSTLLSKVQKAPEVHRFVSAISALSRIIDRALKYDASLPMSIRFQGKFYNVKISLISIIPYYVLRGLSEEKFRKRQKIMIDDMIKKKEPLLNPLV